MLKPAILGLQFVCISMYEQPRQSSHCMRTIDIRFLKDSHKPPLQQSPTYSDVPILREFNYECKTVLLFLHAAL